MIEKKPTMHKFWQIASTFVWQKNSVCIAANGVNISTHQNFDPLGYEPSTCEEFTAAALKAIEKLKAQGIDIGTDWLPKWEPKVGGKVCVWDDLSKGYKVGLYDGPSVDKVFRHKCCNTTWQHIAPFTGEIPEPFKSRWADKEESNKTDKI
jgi:hypothetical protein